MRTKRWIGTVVIAASGAMTLVAGQPDRDIAITGGTRAQQAMVHWAEARFAAAGLVLPPLEIRFHVDRNGCHEAGWAISSTESPASAEPMRTPWLVGPSSTRWLTDGSVAISQVRECRFLELRGLRTSNDPGVAGDERGSEQAAEIMAWALDDQGTGILMPSIPNNSLEVLLADGYEFLTGDPLPSLPGQA